MSRGKKAKTKRFTEKTKRKKEQAPASLRGNR
jgi:hypothetical protein